MRKIYTSYRATNLINNKVYIGFDSNWPKRKDDHIMSAMRGDNITFYNAIRKYGSHKFTWDVIYQSSDGDHTKNIMEEFFIRENHSYIHFENSNGYNMTLGGEGTLGHVHLQITKDRISESNVGKKKSKKSIDKMKETKQKNGYPSHDGQFQKGMTPWNKDKAMSSAYSKTCSIAQRTRFKDPEQATNLNQTRIKGQQANKEKAKIEIVFPDNHSEVMTPSEFAKKYNFNERTVYWNIKKHKSNRIPCGKLAGFILDTKA